MALKLLINTSWNYSARLLDFQSFDNMELLYLLLSIALIFIFNSAASGSDPVAPQSDQGARKQMKTDLEELALS